MCKSDAQKSGAPASAAPKSETPKNSWELDLYSEGVLTRE